jgi:hypothetical protein
LVLPEKPRKEDGGDKGTRDMTATPIPGTPGFEDVLTLTSRKFRIVIQTPKGTELSAADWAYLKGQIEYLSTQEPEPNNEAQQ